MDARHQRHTDALGRALKAKVDELQALGTKQAAWLATELQGWLSCLKPPRLSEIDASVLALACRPTDPVLANIPLPAYARPVTTVGLPALPSRELVPAAAIPGWATRWCHAFSGEAHEAALTWFRQLRHCFRSFLYKGSRVISSGG